MSNTVVSMTDFFHLQGEIIHGKTLLIIGIEHCDACLTAKGAIETLNNSYFDRKVSFVVDLDNQDQISFIMQNRITEFPAILIYNEGARLCGWSGVYSEPEQVHETINFKITQICLSTIPSNAAV